MDLEQVFMDELKEWCGKRWKRHQGRINDYIEELCGRLAGATEIESCCRFFRADEIYDLILKSIVCVSGLYYCEDFLGFGVGVTAEDFCVGICKEDKNNSPVSGGFCSTMCVGFKKKRRRENACNMQV